MSAGESPCAKNRAEYFTSLTMALVFLRAVEKEAALTRNKELLDESRAEIFRLENEREQMRAEWKERSQR